MSSPRLRGLGEIFPDEIEDKVFAYMPADGESCPEKYIVEWQSYAKRGNAEFRYIDNSKKDAVDEQNKLLECNICFISGGNTFILLRNLYRSGLDRALKRFTEKDEFVLSGSSAGALVLTPTIEVCNIPDFDENVVGLEDLTGLGIVNFEVFPHFVEEKHGVILEKYRESSKNEVREIRDGEFIVVDC